MILRIERIENIRKDQPVKANAVKGIGQFPLGELAEQFMRGTLEHMRPLDQYQAAFCEFLLVLTCKKLAKLATGFEPHIVQRQKKLR